ncbi:hypothetical protein T07_12188 [Trichinella nelsoni]|uniref:Uncharacterized protein n=1 Tax=Trichinella nelsoni TaxID=6336 RepID=A0A0V0SIQ4_9BILA|nr:hypothetical protein T07_12188 [Trichinella nelsoni]
MPICAWDGLHRVFFRRVEMLSAAPHHLNRNFGIVLIIDSTNCIGVSVAVVNVNVIRSSYRWRSALVEGSIMAISYPPSVVSHIRLWITYKYGYGYLYRHSMKSVLVPFSANLILKHLQMFLESRLRQCIQCKMQIFNRLRAICKFLFALKLRLRLCLRQPPASPQAMPQGK